VLDGATCVGWCQFGGTDELPRIKHRRYVVWESTANLTGNNPNGEWVIYLFDRKKD